MPKKRQNRSLAFHLKASLFFRQLLSSLWLDVVVCALFVFVLLFYAETTSYALIEQYALSINETTINTANVELAGAGRRSATTEERNPTEANVFSFDLEAISTSAPVSPLGRFGQRVYWSNRQPQAIYLENKPRDHLPEAPYRFLPGHWSDATVDRWLLMEDTLVFPWNNPNMELAYLLSKPSGDGWIIAETHLGLPLTMFIYCLMVIMLIQLLSVLRSLKHNSRSINRILQPLQELAATAQALTAKSGPLSAESLGRLTGALDSINASHLDARLSLSDFSDEMKPLAEAINEMLTRIDEAYREQIRFVSDASHELRTPIAVIQGYADLLTRWGTEDPETMRESIAAIHQEANAMKEMVEQLLFLARGESDSMRLEWQPVDVSTLGSEVLREIEMIDQTHRFTSEIHPSVIVMGDDGMLKQLMRILMDNSIKYTPENGQISLRVGIREGHAVIAVQDEGVGIPEDAITNIFERFYRADASRTRETGGTGLGLSIAKWIAQRHLGSIEVTSRENIGTRMTIVLPLAGNAADQSGNANKSAYTTSVT